VLGRIPTENTQLEQWKVTELALEWEESVLKREYKPAKLAKVILSDWWQVQVLITMELCIFLDSLVKRSVIALPHSKPQESLIEVLHLKWVEPMEEEIHGYRARSQKLGYAFWLDGEVERNQSDVLLGKLSGAFEFLQQTFPEISMLGIYTTASGQLDEAKAIMVHPSVICCGSCDLLERFL
jgi:hypothetical protein